MNDAHLPPEVRALLDETRDDYAPNASVRARVHWRLQARLAEERAERVGKRRYAGRRWKWTVAFLFGSAVAAASIWGDRFVAPWGSKNEVTSAPAVEPTARKIEPVGDARGAAAKERDDASSAAPATSEADVAAERPDALPGDAGRSPTVRSEAGASTPSADKAKSLREELEALRAANALRQSGDAAGALALLNEFERTHPKGVLVQERSAARIFALCAAGRAEEARTRAERFAQLFPKSPHLPRVQRACSRP